MPLCSPDVTVVGSAYVEISPIVATGFGADVVRDAGQQLKAGAPKFTQIGEQLGENLGTGVGKGAATSQGKVEKSLSGLPAAGGAAGKKAGDEFGRQFSAEADKGSERVKHSVAKIGALIGGIGVGVGLASFFKNSVAEGEEANSVLRVTDSILKATHNSAGLTAEQIAKISQNISVKIGVDDEQVQQAGNVLLTFKSIAGSTFQRTLSDAADLSGVLKTDLQGSVKALGRALEDPTKGLARLSKQGITFTDQQKAQIIVLQASGDKLGAQKILLGAIESKYKGAGEAAASATDKIKVAVKNIEEAAGGGIVSLLEGLTPAITDLFASLEPVLKRVGNIVGPIIGWVVKTFQQLGPSIEPVLQSVGAVFLNLASIASPLLVSLGKLADEILPPLAEIFGTIVEAVRPFIGLIGRMIADVSGALQPIITAVTQVFEVFAAALKPVIDELTRGDLNTAVGSITAAFGQLAPIIAKVAGVLAGEIVRAVNVLVPVFDDLVTTISPLISRVLPVLALAWGKIVTSLAPLLPVMASLVGTVARALLPVLPVIAKLLTQVALGFAQLLPPIVKVVGQLVASLAPILPILVRAILAVDKALVGGLISGVLALVKALMPVLPVIVRLISSLARGLAPILPLIAKALSGLLTTALTGIVKAVTPLVPVIVRLADVLGNAMHQSLKQITPLIPELVKSFSELIEAVLPMVPALIPILDLIVKLLPPLLKFSGFITKTQLQILGLLVDGLGAFYRVMVPIGAAVLRVLASGLGKLFDLFGSIAKGFSFDNLGKLGGILGDIGGAIGRFFTGLPGKLAEIPSMIVSFFSGLPNKIVAGLTALATAIGVWIVQNAPGIAERFGTLAEAALSWVVKAVASLPGKLLGIFTAVAKWVVAVGPQIAGKVVDLWVSLVAWIARAVIEMPGKLVGLELALGQWVLDVAPKVAAKVAGLAVHLLSWIADAVKQAPGKLLEFAGTVLTFLVNLPGTLAGKVLEIAPKLVKAMLGIGKSIVQGISDGISGAVSGAVDLAKNLFNALAGFVNEHIVQKVKDFEISLFGKKFHPFGSFPLIPTFAQGGVTTEGRIDGNGSTRREVVIPLERGRARIFDLLRQSGIEAMLSSSGQLGPGGGGDTSQSLSSREAAFLRLYAAADTAQRHYIDQVAAFMAALTSKASAALGTVSAAMYTETGGKPGLNTGPGSKTPPWFTPGFKSPSASASGDVHDALAGIAMMVKAVPATAEFFKIMSTAGPELYAYMAKIAAGTTALNPGALAKMVPTKFITSPTVVTPGKGNEAGGISKVAEAIAGQIAVHIAAATSAKPAPHAAAPTASMAKDIADMLQLIKHVDYLFGGPGAHVKEVNPKKGEPVTLNQWLNALNGSTKAGATS